MIIALVAVFAAIGLSSMFKRASAPVSTAAGASAGQLEVLPAQAFANTELNARVAGVKGRNAELASCTWYRNGVRIPDATTSTLDPSHFSRGDEIAVEAVVEPGEAAQRSAPVTIQNSRPSIMSAMASQRNEGAEIGLQMNAIDNDGDAVTYQYAWFRNGEAITGANGSTVDVSGFHSGDKVYARIVANDGQDDSSPYNSAPVVLGSEALAITSTPPSATSGGRYQYQVTTTDAEPGTVHYELLQAPAGMTIDGNGRIDWELPQDLQEVVVHQVEVRVAHDSGTEATQRFSITTGPVTQAAVGQ